MNSVFHPPGKNPFQLPPLPQSYYLPSPIKETPDKDTTLTPQKLKHRHEYSLPPEVYTPEQYSICEEDTISGKPPLPSSPRKPDDVTVDLRKYLDDVTWTSSQFCEQWPSKDSQTFHDVLDLKSFEATEMSRSNQILSSTQRSSSKQTAPVRLKSSFASDRNSSRVDSDRTSIITKRLNRFRYGEPKPRQERAKERSKLPLPSTVGRKTPVTSSPSVTPRQKPTTIGGQRTTGPSRRLENTVNKDLPHVECETCHARKAAFVDDEPSMTHPKTTVLDSPKAGSPDRADISISTLNSRLEKLLHESAAVTSSPVPPAYCNGSPLTPSVDTSGNLDSKVSSLGSDDLKTQLTLGKFRKDFPVHRPENIRRNLTAYDLPPKRHWQDENSPPRAPISPSKIRLEDDILQQWRLRRKLEMAREDVAKNKAPCYADTYQRPRYLTRAERPLGDDRVTEDRCLHPSNIRGTFQAETVQSYAQFTHKPSCSCQPGTPTVATSSSAPQPGAFAASPPEERAPTPFDTTAPRTGCRISYSPSRKKKSVGVGVTLMKSMETQTGRSLIFSDEEMFPTYRNNLKSGSITRSASENSLQHTSTPASSVSFHRVKIVQAEPENSPVTSKGSPQAKGLSPLSSKTDATTVWSGTEQNKSKRSEEDARSQGSHLSSIKMDQRFPSDSETCSPTANVVHQIVGARLFSSTQTPVSTSRIARLQKSKLQATQGNDKTGADPCLDVSLSSSYTSTLRPQRISEGVDSTSECSDKAEADSKKCDLEDAPGTSYDLNTEAINSIPASTELRPVSSEADHSEQTRVKEVERGVVPGSPASIKTQESAQPVAREAEFDPLETFEKLLSEIENDPGDFTDDPVLQTLRSQRDQFLADFRAIEREIEEQSEEESVDE